MREFKKMVYLKELECERQLKEGIDSAVPENNFYDEISKHSYIINYIRL